MWTLAESWFFLLVLLLCIGVHFRRHPGRRDGPEVSEAGEGARPSRAEGGMAMLDVKVWFWSLGVTSAASFVLCVLWGLVTPEGLHMHRFLELVLPGFEWLTAASFLIGLVESFAYGAYGALVFVPLHNLSQRRWGSGGAAS
jgi:hypothetical protein